MLKTCTRCGLEKPTDEFYDQSRNHDNKRSWCKTCCSSWSREYLISNPDRVRESKAKYVYKPEDCIDCGKLKRVAKRFDGGPVCASCLGKRHKQKCSMCGKIKVTNSRLETGEPICSNCYRKIKPRELCYLCGKLKAIAKRTDNGALCYSCLNKTSISTVINGLKRGASRRNLEWSLTDDQTKELISSTCFYCGISPTESVRGFLGIDRIDNFIGYTYDNCVACCWDCNRAKNIMEQTRFLNLCAKIYLYRGLNKPQ